MTVTAATATRDSARPADDGGGTDGCAVDDREAYGCDTGGCEDGTGGSGGRAAAGAAGGGFGDGEGR
ncbi:hypothetical protein ACGF4C_36585 [Streptomyces sp. NPDC048197]|uniref:hypothetical protein n=1 Tax=Streptomyces sp. NPDC048197 TaxID=3365511 RepID=UPI003717179B